MDRELVGDKPIFQQIAEKIESSILEESLSEGDRVPSTNEIAKFYQINPATAAKGINLLVDDGVIYKKRGIGMFVTEGAKRVVLEKRKGEFFYDYIVPLRKEASKIGITMEELHELLQEEE